MLEKVARAELICRRTNPLRESLGLIECSIHGHPRGAKVPDSVMLPGEISYFPHPSVASALLHPKYAKQFNGREDLEGKRPFFGRFHHVALLPTSWINGDSFNATSATRADRGSRQIKTSHSSQTFPHAR
jgi:hypothetical protein